MRKILMSCLMLICFITAPIELKAQNTSSENLVQIRLLAEQGKVTGGDEIWIGIEQVIKPHWHTYWKNPGDSGTITKANWNLPKGYSISDIHWPTPKRIPYGPLMNYGYEDNVVLLQKLKLPSNIGNRPITLTADIELLVCKEECIPEYGTYTLTLNGDNAANEDNAAFIENAVSKLPVETDWNAEFSNKDENFKLSVKLPSDIASDIKLGTLTLYPLDWGLIENAAPQSALMNENTIIFTQSKGERDLSELKTADFIISYIDEQGLDNSFKISAQPLSAINTVEQASQTSALTSIAKALIFALLGGLVLNLMPCVFPVLSIKALSLVKIADEHPNLAKLHGISYTAGVILSFLLIAGTLLILKSAGAQIGWGFQLQNPLVVGGLAYLLFIIGLNLMGYFEFGQGLGNIGNNLTQGNGLKSSFFTGVLATLVATPCTAPFMAGAIGFALTQTTFINLIIFAALGLGLALPYLALSFVPALQTVMPKPGAWMNTFKQLLAFPMFFAAIWLVWVLSKQAGSTGVLQILVGMGLIGFAIWIFGIAKRKLLKVIAILLLALSALMLIIPTAGVKDTNTTTESKEFGTTFSPEKLETLLNDSNDPVFIEMTAAWCITCKVNHATSINIPSTKKAFANNNVQYLIGDWTNQDPEITKFLNKYGRNGVPIYVYYGPKENNGDRPEAKILPQILTPNSIPKLFE